MTRLLLAGATGLVGSEALRLILADGRVARVVAPTRRPLPPHPKRLNPITGIAHVSPAPIIARVAQGGR